MERAKNSILKKEVETYEMQYFNQTIIIESFQINLEPVTISRYLGPKMSSLNTLKWSQES